MDFIRSMIHGYIQIFVFLYFIWKYLFRDSPYPNATLTQKLLHSAAFIYVGCRCWWGLYLVPNIIFTPVQWFRTIADSHGVFPIWVEAAVQASRAFVGSAGLLFCFRTLRGVDAARRKLIALIPFLYTIDCYLEFEFCLRHYAQRAILVAFFASLLLALPYLAVFIFYRRPSVIRAFFKGVARSDQARNSQAAGFRTTRANQGTQDADED